jgi:hypothetical protein
MYKPSASLSHTLAADRHGGRVAYAPLYCATSSPSTKTLSFCSISSAMASFSASRTVISFCPDAYPLRATNDGVRAGARNAGRKARRAAGRRSREAAIVVVRCRVWRSWGWIDRGRVMALLAVCCWDCLVLSSTISSESGIHLTGKLNTSLRVRVLVLSAFNPTSRDLTDSA